MLTSLIDNKILTAQTASKVPRLTGSNAASNAPQTSRENLECLRAASRIMPIQKQIAGVAITIGIQNNGVADQSLLAPGEGTGSTQGPFYTGSCRPAALSQRAAGVFAQPVTNAATREE